MNNLSNEQIIDLFFSKISFRNFQKKDFYEVVIDFLENNNISIDRHDEIESSLYKEALRRGYIGYKIIKSITDMNYFEDRFLKYFQKSNGFLFHFMYERDDELLLSFSESWKLWNQAPPLGWFGTYCKCGEFFPYTLDMGEMDLENNTIRNNFSNLKPIKFSLNDIKSIDFCSDTFMRFRLADNVTILAKPFKFDTNLIFNFLENPLELI